MLQVLLSSLSVFLPMSVWLFGASLFSTIIIALAFWRLPTHAPRLITPNPKSACFILAVFMAYLSISLLLTHLAPAPLAINPIDVYFIISAIVLAPIGEELLFRGLMMARFCHAPRFGAVLTSMLFAVGHGQYGMVAWALLFCLGVILSMARVFGVGYAIALHAINNTAALLFWLWR